MDTLPWASAAESPGALTTFAQVHKVVIAPWPGRTEATLTPTPQLFFPPFLAASCGVWDLSSQPQIKPAPTALEACRVLTAGPPGKFEHSAFEVGPSLRSVPSSYAQCQS